MIDLVWFLQVKMHRIAPYFSLSHGVPRVADRKVISGIIFVMRSGLRLCNAPKD